MLNNICIFNGKIAKNMDYRMTKDGEALLNFTICLSTTKKNSEGKRIYQFANCVAYKNTAIFIQENFKAGDFIIVQTNYLQEKYMNKQGVEQTLTKFFVQRVDFAPREYKNDNNNSNKNFI
jgi:single-strand DNA-binding protein